MRTEESYSVSSAIACLVAAIFLLGAFSAVGTAQQGSESEIDQKADAMLAKLTLQQKIELLGGEDSMFTHAMASIGLPQLKMSDGPVGVRTWGPDTAYAAGIGLAASWDTALALRVGVSLGRDARARGVNFLLGPGVDIYRLPLNGRNFEYFGEDPYLASRIAVNYIEGVQSQHVVATIKHYALNNSEYDRHNENSVADERTMREIYLPTFEAAVKEAHVGAIMDSYNLINGVHATQSAFLNKEVLRKDWGFRGIVMSDWGATYDGIAAANNGLDLEMPSPRFMNQRTLLPAIQSGQVSTATIDQKVRRILRIALRFGFCNNDQLELSVPLYNEKSNQVALESAEEGMVLLKNQGHLLPLDGHRIRSIAMIGPDAYPGEASAGGSAHVTPFAPVSFLTGLSDALGSGAKVYWNSGVQDLTAIFGAGGFGGSSFATDAQGTHPGLKQEEFAGASFEGEPTRTRTVMHVSSFGGNMFAPRSRVRNAYRYSGYYIPKTSGPQRFIATAVGGDQYKLYVNGQPVLQSTPREGQSPQSASVNLPARTAASVRFDYLPQTGRIRAGLGVVPEDQLLDPNVTKVAAMADVAVVSVGFNERSEGEGHDRTYQLPMGQAELIKAVVAANPRTIVVITSGGSVATSQWIGKAPALIQSWYGGSEAGRALAAVLFGKVNPSGKLPISWERRIEDDPAYKNYYEEPGSHDVDYREGIFIGYRYFDQASVKPLFPFGFGLSYTTFSFSGLRVTPAEASAHGPLSVSFTVKNTGERAGAEVAELYIGDPSAKAPRPVRELKGFERVFLNPGEAREVTFNLNRRSLAYWDTGTKGWKVDPGKFMVYAGDSSENVPLRAAFTVR
ncbi:MAG: glycoside hydrolase family 3 C-terminal domain-containing protein [Terriglobia bacterium]